MIDNDIDKYIVCAGRVASVARVQTRMSYDDYVEEHLKRVSYSFGKMPGQRLFMAYANAHLDGELYPIRHGSGPGTEDHPFCMGGDWNAEELYDLLHEAVRMFEAGESDMDDEMSAICIASDVMMTLSFDWI